MEFTDAIRPAMQAVRAKSEEHLAEYRRSSPIGGAIAVGSRATEAFARYAGLAELCRAWLRAEKWEDALDNAIACTREVIRKWNASREYQVHIWPETADDELTKSCRSLCEAAGLAFKYETATKLIQRRNSMTTATEEKPKEAAPVIDRAGMIEGARKRLESLDAAHKARVADISNKYETEKEIVTAKHKTMLEAEVAKLKAEADAAIDKATRANLAAVAQWQNVIDSHTKAASSAADASAVEVAPAAS